MNGLQPALLRPPGFLARLFGLMVKENAFIEVENLLAGREIGQVLPAEIESILAKYKVKPSATKRPFETTFRKVLQHFVRDQNISDAEAADLQRLRNLLGLSDSEVRAIEHQVFGGAYEEAVNVAVRDGKLTADERENLDSLRRKLRLDEAIAHQIYASSARAVLQDIMSRAIADRRLSPAEDQELKAVAESLGASVSTDEATIGQLERFRLFWRAEQADFPALDVPIQLQRGERCWSFIPATHHEYRTVTEKTRYSGTSYSVRICKGLSWRVGTVRREPVKREVLMPLDSGTLYLTTKRLLFDGSRKNTSIGLRKVTNFQVYADGLQIEKDTGKDQFFLFSGDVEFVNVMLDAAIRAIHA